MWMKSKHQMPSVDKTSNFEHIPSNLLGRLIHGSFAGDGIIKTHLNDVNT
jgi:hypothetical protein